MIENFFYSEKMIWALIFFGLVSAVVVQKLKQLKQEKDFRNYKKILLNAYQEKCRVITRDISREIISFVIAVLKKKGLRDNVLLEKISKTGVNSLFANDPGSTREYFLVIEFIREIVNDKNNLIFKEIDRVHSIVRQGKIDNLSLYIDKPAEIVFQAEVLLEMLEGILIKIRQQNRLFIENHL